MPYGHAMRKRVNGTVVFAMLKKKKKILDEIYYVKLI